MFHMNTNLTPEYDVNYDNMDSGDFMEYVNEYHTHYQWDEYDYQLLTNRSYQ